MTPENFCYWLKGIFELTDVDLNKRHLTETLSREQVDCIKQHLDYVFAPKVYPEPSKDLSDALRYSSADIDMVKGAGAKIS